MTNEILGYYGKNIKFMSSAVEFYKLETKGDFIDYAMKYDDRIKAIDSAIDQDVFYDLSHIIEGDFSTIYYKNGTIEIVDIIAYSTILYIRKNRGLL